MTKSKDYKYSRIWLTATILSVLTACGGGGGGGGGSDSSSGGGTDSGSSGVTVSGGASKGPLNGAIIKVFDIDAYGAISGAELPITDTTLDDGTFTLTFGAHVNDHPHLLQAVGGFYMDESDQNGIRKVDFGSVDISLEAILPAGETTVAVTPYSNALYLKSYREANSNGTDFQAVFDQNRLLAEGAYGFDIVATLPDDPVNPVSSDNDRKLYGQLLGGAANAINNIAIAVGLPQADKDTIALFVRDLSDGTVDSLEYTTPLSATNSARIPDVDLGAEIERFRNNNQSVYGSLLADVDSDLLSKSAVAVWDEFNWDEALWQAPVAP